MPISDREAKALDGAAVISGKRGGRTPASARGVEAPARADVAKTPAKRKRSAPGASADTFGARQESAAAGALAEAGVAPR